MHLGRSTIFWKVDKSNVIPYVSPKGYNYFYKNTNNTIDIIATVADWQAIKILLLYKVWVVPIVGHSRG